MSVAAGNAHDGSEARDHETHGHSQRVINFSLRLGHELGLDKQQMMSLEFGTLLHVSNAIAHSDEPHKVSALDALGSDRLALLGLSRSDLAGIHARTAAALEHQLFISAEAAYRGVRQEPLFRFLWHGMCPS